MKSRTQDSVYQFDVWKQIGGCLKLYRMDRILRDHVIWWPEPKSEPSNRKAQYDTSYQTQLEWLQEQIKSPKWRPLRLEKGPPHQFRTWFPPTIYPNATLRLTRNPYSKNPCLRCALQAERTIAALQKKKQLCKLMITVELFNIIRSMYVYVYICIFTT